MKQTNDDEFSDIQLKNNNNLNKELYNDERDVADDGLFAITNIIDTLNLDNLPVTIDKQDSIDDDINFDYEYGYDYQAIIRERLKTVNEEFAKDSTPSEKKITKVSFDSSVIAFTTATTTTTTEANENNNKTIIEDINNQVKEEKEEDIDEYSTNDTNNDTKRIINQIPLNDTQLNCNEKSDAFNKKIKNVLLKYDNNNNNDDVLNKAFKINDDINVDNKQQIKTPTTTVKYTLSPLKVNKFNNNKTKSSSSSITTANMPKSSLKQNQNKSVKTKLIIDDNNNDIIEEILNEKNNLKPIKDDNKVLIEKDGKFLYVNSDEYISIHKIQQTQSTSTSSTSINSNKLPSSINNRQQQHQQQLNKKDNKELNERAFQEWLKNKEKLRLEEIKKNENNLKNLNENKLKIDEAKKAYDKWLEMKNTQLLKEKERVKKIEEIEKSYSTIKTSTTATTGTTTGTRTNSPDKENSIAFRQWLKKKYQEKQEAKRTAKLEKRKWTNRLRKSLKYQRLSQAIEMAQIYGYTSFYYKTGFNH